MVGELIMSQAAWIIASSNAVSATACIVMACMVLWARVRRADLVCPFYAYPIISALVLVAGGYIAELTSVFARVGLVSVVASALTAASLGICAFYVFDMLADVVSMPSPRATATANKELAKAVADLTEGHRDG